MFYWLDAIFPDGAKVRNKRDEITLFRITGIGVLSQQDIGLTSYWRQFHHHKSGNLFAFRDIVSLMAADIPGSVRINRCIMLVVSDKNDKVIKLIFWGVVRGNGTDIQF